MKKTKNLLSLLSPTEKEELFAGAKIKKYSCGDLLFTKGDKANKLYVVNKGQVKLVRITPSGEEKVFKVFLPHGVIAEMAMFMSEQVYPMTAIVEVDCELLEIEKTGLFSLISKSPELAINIMSFMTQRISFLMNTIDTLTQVNAEQRFVMFLSQLYVNQQPENSAVRLPFSKKVIAQQICVKPETLSRILKKLKDKDLLIERGPFLQLPDIDKLCQAVDLYPDIF